MVEIPAPNDPSGIADDNLILAIEDGIAFVTINRPGARNAFARELRERVTAFLMGEVRDNPDVKVVLIQGTGKSFIAGGDIKAFGLGLKMSPEDRSADMKDRAAGAGGFNALLHSLPQPVVVAARGPAVGVGASVIFAADLAIVSDNAKVGLTHVGLGISPDGAGTYFLPHQVGLKRAAQVALLGEMMGADELLSMGLVNWVVPDEELEDRALTLARKLAAGASAALQATKRLLHEAFSRDVDGQVAAEADALGACALTDDYVEGLSAMLEKRKAAFGKPR
jgi:2-(1,2-epoxy-1,2-dihydrophenyl)acetyl-CoA isomerase